MCALEKATQTHYVWNGQKHKTNKKPKQHKMEAKAYGV